MQEPPNVLCLAAVQWCMRTVFVLIALAASLCAQTDLSGLAVKMKDGGKTVRWHIDTERGVATPEKPAAHLARYTVPLRPMLGCVAVAPAAAQAAPATGDSASMAQWLADDYKLTPSEVAQVLGTAAEYHVSEAADRNAGIALKIGKERLKF